MLGLDDGKKQSVINTHSVPLLTSFVGALPAGAAEQEEDAESPRDFEVPSVRDAVGPPLVCLLLGLLTSGLVDFCCCSRHTFVTGGP